jgi:drug/metabolite transporter (DMT)-like permease
MRSRGSHNEKDHSLYSEDGWIESPYEHISASADDADDENDTRHNDPLTLHRLKGTSGTMKAVPGRPRRRKPRNASSKDHDKGNPRNKHNAKPSWWWLTTSPRWSRFWWWATQWFPTMNSNNPNSNNSKLVLAVILWYTLGILSISTSKLLLTTSQVAPNHPRYFHHVGGVPPLFLTLQQFLLGSTFLRFLLSMNFLNSPGLQPWSVVHSLGTPSHGDNHNHSNNHNNNGRQFKRSSSNGNSNQASMLATLSQLLQARHTRYVLLAGTFFTIGFLATNMGFSGSSAAFVETIKAAEPITSAALCVLWKIEYLSPPEMASLASIVAGVVLSTVGNGSSTATTTTTNHHHAVTTTLAASLTSCVIVMASNLCFSFRGLYQKLFRDQHDIPVAVLDDLNLQFRFQQLGVWILGIPVLIWNGPGILRHVYLVSTMPHVGLLTSGILMRYIGLALLNGLAFTSYK